MRPIAWLIVVLVLLIAYARLSFVRQVAAQQAVDLANVTFNTGDILMYKVEVPMLWREHDRLNLDFCIDTLVRQAGMFYGHRGLPYTHVGVVILLGGRPYVLELTRRLSFDHYHGRYVMTVPSLHQIEEVNLYDGFVFLHKYNGQAAADPYAALRAVFGRPIVLGSNMLLKYAASRLFGRPASATEYTCVDFALLVLRELGILRGPIPLVADINDIAAVIVADPEYEKAPILLDNVYHRQVTVYF